jgi:translation initiation factor IF-3
VEPKKFVPRNFQIKAAEVRVISEDGEQLGVMPLGQAVQRAQEAGMDLVAVSANATPPVTKIVEFSKYVYEQKQRDKRARQNTKEVELKELRFGSTIGEHDVDIRIERAREFLKDGDKIKLNCQFKGRMITHPEVGRAKIERIISAVADLADVERAPYQEGRTLQAILQPKK